mgnify:CR=1 FL=1
MIPKKSIKPKDKSNKDCVKSNELRATARILPLLEDNIFIKPLLLSRVSRVRFPGGSPKSFD